LKAQDKGSQIIMPPFPGFDAKQLDSFLTRAEQQAVLRDMRAISVNPKNSLYVGQCFDRLQRKLTPFGYLTKVIAALHAESNIAQRTLYGYMYGYRNALRLLPPGAAQAMAERNLLVDARNEPLGIWTEVIARIPPPARGGAAVYRRWVSEIIARRAPAPRGPLANATPRDPDVLLLEMFRVLERQAKRLPPNRATRAAWLRRFVGMAMTHFEVTEGNFAPVAIPPAFPARRNQLAEPSAILV
jgi:hypothetical protein